MRWKRVSALLWQRADGAKVFRLDRKKTKRARQWWASGPAFNQLLGRDDGRTTTFGTHNTAIDAVDRKYPSEAHWA